MQKLFKKAISIILSVMLLLSALGGAISINAETPENYYGTPENGYNSVNAGDFLSLDPAAAPMNLDFSDGFTYWSAKSDRAGSASDMMTLRTENGATYLEPKFGENAIVTANGNDSNSAWAGIASAKFKIPGVKRGDRVTLMLNIDMHVTSGAPLGVNIRQFTPDGEVAGIDGIYDADLNAIVGKIERTFSSDWHSTAVSELGYTYTGVTPNVHNNYLTVVDPDATFSIQIQDASTVADAKAATSARFTISNLKVLVYNQTDAELYPDSSNANKTYPTYTAYTNGATPETRYFDGVLEGGSATDGYTSLDPSRKGYISRYGILDAPTNLDFSQGLKYWGICFERMAIAKTSDYATVENGVLTLKPKTTNWQDGVTSQKFRAPDVKTGDKLRFYAEYKLVEPAKLKDVRMRIHSYTTSANKLQGVPTGTVDSAHRMDVAVSTTAALYEKASGWMQIVKEVTVENPDDIYDISFQYTDKGTKNAETGIYDNVSQVSIKNVYVTNVKNGTQTDLSTGNPLGSPDGQPFGGTEEDGIIVTNYNGTMTSRYRDNWYLYNNDLYGTSEGLVNNDFSLGFKHWGIRTYTAQTSKYTKLSEQATVDKTTGILSFLPVTTDAGTNDIYPGFTSQAFTLPGVSAGDELILTADIRNTVHSSSYDLQLREMGYYTDTIVQPVATGKANVGNTSSNWKTVSTGKLTVTKTDNIFMITLQRKAESTGQIKNLRIYKVLNNAQFVDVTKGYSAEAPVVNGNGGTEQDGLLELGGSLTFDLPAESSLMNGDFSQGLKYWAPRKEISGYTSSFASVSDGVLTVNTTSYQGVKSVPITPSSEFIGKKLALKFDVNAASAMFQVFIYKNGTEVANNNMGGTVKGSQILFGTNNITVAEGDKFVIEFKGGDTGSFNLSNVDLVVVDDSDTILTYKNFSGFEYFKDGTPFGGTEEDGIAGDYFYSGHIQNYTFINVAAVDGFVNGDFSQGFKYWTLKCNAYKVNHYLSEEATLDRETGIVTLNEIVRNDGLTDNTWSGITSQPFTLNNIKVDDILYSAVDTRANAAGIDITIGRFDGANTTQATYKSSLNASTEEWVTAYSDGITATSVTNKFFVQMQRKDNLGGRQIKNFRVLRADRGGLAEAPKVNIDGTLIDASLYGDANNDGAVNLIDIVRMKREAAYGGNNGFGIFLAAVDLDNDDTIGATDFTAVIGKVLDPTVAISK